MSKRHKHADLIKQWLDGVDIQYRSQVMPDRWDTKALRLHSYAERLQTALAAKEQELAELRDAVSKAIDELINLQPHIAQSQDRAFIDPHVDNAIELLRHWQDGGGRDE